MKKLLSITAFLLIYISNIKAYDIEIDNIYYNLDVTEKTATVTNNGTKSYQNSSIIIPNKINHNGTKFNVEIIAANAFDGCSNITSISLPKNLRKIEDFAFKIY